MRLGYFTMPMHPLDTDYTTTLKQDREAIMLCDKLGYHDAFVGEHLTDDAENITNSMLFLGTLIHSIQMQIDVESEFYDATTGTWPDFFPAQQHNWWSPRGNCVSGVSSARPTASITV